MSQDRGAVAQVVELMRLVSYRFVSNVPTKLLYSSVITTVPHPWCLQLSLFHGCLFPTGVSVQNPLMLLLWLGHAADVLDVLAAWQMCMGLVGAMWCASSHPAILFHVLFQESQCFWDPYSSAYFVWHSPQKDFLTNKWPVRLHMPCSLRKPG